MGSAAAGIRAPNGLARWQTPLLVIAACALIAVIGFGTRSVFGLFLPPMTEARGWSRDAFSLAMATQQLTFGVVLPLAAASSDRFGPVRVMVAGAVAYALGLWFMTQVESSLVFLLVAGLLVGGTNAFTSFSLVIATMARMVEPKRRPLVMGLGMAAGSLGQVIFSPITQGFISAYGWSDALLILAVGFLAIVPLAFLLPGNPEVAAEQTAKESVGAAIREA
ncbi:MAG: MFS transporter, partial [Chloroflexota bacterium]|nr:MFS transporter [Chloroflexota bacterium]